MFTWAIGCGIFSFYILALGILGMLSYPYILIGTAGFSIFTYFMLRNHCNVQKCFLYWQNSSYLDRIFLMLIVLSVSVNLLGALGPEIGFDAVWYHLTIPRIWLSEEKIFYIQYGPFSYSLLPKLLEMLYVPALLFGNQIWAKIIHWLFGCLVGLVTYRLARTLMTRSWALATVVIFYSNLVVGWQSITAYIDLGRTFYETVALLSAVYALKTTNSRWWYLTAVLVGLALMTKILAVTSLLALGLLLLYNRQLMTAVKFSLIAVVIPAPWFVLNYVQTGNPVHPIFSGYDLSSTGSVWDIFSIWWTSADPLSPLYMMLLPILLLFAVPRFHSFFKTSSARDAKLYKQIGIYLGLVLFIWWLTPRTGGGRFILPYLPVCSVFLVYPLSRLTVHWLQKFSICAIIMVSLFSTLYRATANWKYVALLSGNEPTEAFLKANLPQNFGDNWYYLTDDSLHQLYTSPERPNNLQWQYQIK